MFILSYAGWRSQSAKFSTVHSGMGVHLVDRGAPKYQATLDAWIKTCDGCHSSRFARDQLEAADEAIKVAFAKWRVAMKKIVDLYNDGILDPIPQDLAPDWNGHYTFSMFPGGEGRISMYHSSKRRRLKCSYTLQTPYTRPWHTSVGMELLMVKTLSCRTDGLLT